MCAIYSRKTENTLYLNRVNRVLFRCVSLTIEWQWVDVKKIEHIQSENTFYMHLKHTFYMSILTVE